MSQIQPSKFLIRSPHYRTLLAEGATFVQHRDVVLIDNFGKTPEEEAYQAQQLGLVDLTSFARTGFKGKAAINWAQTQELKIGEVNNQAYLQNNGALIARLADTEILVLNNLHSKQDQCTSIEDEYRKNNPNNCYSVPRKDSSSWLLITGKNASAMFAKICAVDLRTQNFPNRSIAQTSIARINGIIIRDDINKIPAYHLIFDSASTDYMWTCLKDASQEFAGAPVGYAAISAM